MGLILMADVRGVLPKYFVLRVCSNAFQEHSMFGRRTSVGVCGLCGLFGY